MASSKDYLEFIEDQRKKGYLLDEFDNAGAAILDKQQFESFYNRLAIAKRKGEIKSSPWQELKKRTRYEWHDKRIRNLVLAAEEQGLGIEFERKDGKWVPNYKELWTEGEVLKGRKWKALTTRTVSKLSKAAILDLIDYIKDNKESGLFGGHYE